MCKLYFFCAVLLSFACTASATCYMPNGTKVTDPAYQPCVQTEGAVSMCCGTNHSSAVVANDICLPNGLCQNWDTYDDGKTLPLLWRGTCTDPTWNSPNCLKNICFSGSDANGNHPVSNCTDGTFCCGGDETKSCCQLSTGKFNLAATIGVTSSSSATTATSPSTVPPSSVTTSGSATALLSTTQSAAAGSGLNTGDKVGIGVGVPMGVVVIAAVGALIYFAYRKRKVRGHELEAKEAPYRKPAPQTQSHDLPPVEVEGTPRAEME